MCDVCPLLPLGVENQDPGARATAEQDGVVTLLAIQRDANQASLNDQATLGTPASTRLSTGQRKSFKKRAKKAMLAAETEHAVAESQVVDNQAAVTTPEKETTAIERSSTQATKVAASAGPPRSSAKHAKQSAHNFTPPLSTTSTPVPAADASAPAAAVVPAGMSRATFATLLQFMIAVPIEGAPVVPSNKAKPHSQRQPAKHFQAAAHPKGAFRCSSSRR